MSQLHWLHWNPSQEELGSKYLSGRQVKSLSTISGRASILFCPTFELCTPITRWVQWEELCAPQLSRVTQEGWLRTSHPWHTPAQALPSPSSTLYTQHPLPRSLLRALAIAAPFPAPPDTHTSGSHFTPQLLLLPWPCLLRQPQDTQHGWQCHEAAARLQKGAVKPPRLCLNQKRPCQGPGNGRVGAE